MEWVKRNVVGRVSKYDLDVERMKETNMLDMMQNTGIIYHTESIVEMQIAVSLICYFLSLSVKEDQIKQADESH